MATDMKRKEEIKSPQEVLRAQMLPQLRKVERWEGCLGQFALCQPHIALLWGFFTFLFSPGFEVSASKQARPLCFLTECSLCVIIKKSLTLFSCLGYPE